MLHNCSTNPLPEDDFLTSDGALSVISEITAVTENRDLSHLAKVTIGKILDNSEGGAGFDPSYIAAILSEINDVNALEKDRIDELVSARELMNCDPEMDPIFSACTVEKARETPPSIADLWQPIVCNERKRMEFKKIEIESEGGKKVAGKTEYLRFPLLQPKNLEAYSKIYTTYPLLTTPATIEEDRERGDAGGSLNIIDNPTFDSSSWNSNSNVVEGSSLLSGFDSAEQEAGAAAAAGGRPLSKGPAPPSGGKTGSASRDTRVNRQQRKVTSRPGNSSKGEYKFRGV
jgi:hypothetical protein